MRSVNSLIALFSWMVACAPAWADPEPLAASLPAIREIHVRVLGLNGKGAAHRHVQLWGVSRSGLRDDDEKFEPNWDFDTDQAGRCVVRLADGKWAGAGSLPGWGTYAIRAVPESMDAGAFSPYLIHEEDAWTQKSEMRDRRNLEWGRPVVISRREMELTLRIEPGFTIRGRVLRYPDRQPLPDFELGGMYDLYAESHTGFGAQVEGPGTKTDAHGRYTLRHVYPSKLFVGISRTWVQSKRDHGPWEMDALDRIEPARGQRTVTLQIMAAKGKPFHVFGHVKDAGRAPVAGANVTVAFGRHRETYQWHEEHVENVTTDATGDYEIWLEYPFIMGVSVNAEGYAKAIHPRSDDDLARLSPGRFDFTLK